MLFFARSGAIYLDRVLSLWVQVDGLVGAQRYFAGARISAGRAASRLATDALFLSADALLAQLERRLSAFPLRRRRSLFGSAYHGRLRADRVADLFCLFFTFRSAVAGQTFLSFQWDILLLEAGFLAIFFAPVTWWMSAKREAPISRVAFFLLQAAALQTDVHVRVR